MYMLRHPHTLSHSHSQVLGCMAVVGAAHEHGLIVQQVVLPCSRDSWKKLNLKLKHEVDHISRMLVGEEPCMLQKDQNQSGESHAIIGNRATVHS